MAVLGTVLAVLVGAFVVWQFVWPRGGAGSPEEAVQQFIDAGASQDPLALLDVVAPDEVAGLSAVIERAKERADEEELINGDGLTDALEVELTDLEFDVDELGDDLARVSLVDGDYDVSWDPAKLPDRLDFLRDESDREAESGDLSELFDGEEPFVTTVKVDGRWYVTAVGTLAEFVHDVADEELDDLGRPDYDALGEDVDPVVGEDPEEVIEGLLETISRGDADELLASLPGELTRPLRPYTSLVEDGLDGRYSEGPLSLDISAEGLDLTTEDLDDERIKVVIEGGTFTATASEEGYDANTGVATFDGRCVTGSSYDDSGYHDDEETWCFGGDDEFAEVLSDLDIDEFFVVMTEVDDGYQLDPIATVVEYAAAVLDGLDEQLVDDLIDQLRDDL